MKYQSGQYYAKGFIMHDDAEHTSGHVSVSDDDLEQMDSDSSEDAIPAQQLKSMLERMSTNAREAKLRWLHKLKLQESGTVEGNPVLAILSNVPPPLIDQHRRRFHGHRDNVLQETKPDAAINSKIDKMLQKEVRRKLRRWRKSLKTANEHEHHDQMTPPRHPSSHQHKPTDKSEDEGSAALHHMSMVDSVPSQTMTPLQRQQLQQRKAVEGTWSAEQLLQLDRMHQMQLMGPKTVIIRTGNVPNTKKPKMVFLKSAGSKALAQWQHKLKEFDIKVKRYQRVDPHYLPDLSDWVDDKVWAQISRSKLLLPEDRTVGSAPPNDEAVVDFLRQRNKYATSLETGKVRYPNPAKAFRQIEWRVHETFVRGYEEYIHKWDELKSTMYKAQIPKAERRAEIMFEAIKPDSLRERVEGKMDTQAGYPSRKKSGVMKRERIPKSYAS